MTESVRRREQQRKSNGKLVQLMICTMLFIAAVAVKTLELGGEEARNIFLSQLEHSLDVRQTVETIGRAVTVPYQKAFTEEETAVIPVTEEQAEPAAEETAVFGEGTVSVMGTLPVEEPMNSEPAQPDDSGEPEPPDIVYTGSVNIPFDYVTPVAGRITSGFGYRDHPIDGEYKYHYGIDIAADRGDPIYCFADGEVTFVGLGQINGNYMKITHSDGFVTMYAHCDSIDVKVGDRVSMGERIAYAGSTGTVSGSHLHFQIYSDGMLIDPALYLEGLTWA